MHPTTSLGFPNIFKHGDNQQCLKRANKQIKKPRTKQTTQKTRERENKFVKTEMNSADKLYINKVRNIHNKYFFIIMQLLICVDCIVTILKILSNSVQNRLNYNKLIALNVKK